MYITLTKKRISVILFAAVLLFILVGQFFSVKANEIDASTNLKRVQFINTLGITLKSDDYKEKTVTIPQQFGAVYSNYNALQRKAGFDLLGYRGKQVKIYTYNIDGETVVNLMVYKDRLIGGDIASLKIDGQMTALKESKNGDRTV
ncbi:MAG: DUF4830 domain-containing protein [Clostridia bacterium]|nr:DUF4830 domain-containing protein [Clostridia bacterium]